MAEDTGWRRNSKGGLFNIYWIKCKKVDSKTFSQAVSKVKSSRSPDNKWRVSEYPSEHYENSNCYVAADGSTIAVAPDGDIVSVCAHGSSVRGTGKQLMQFAVDHGGVKLDSFSGNHRFYTKCGFEPVSWIPFDADAMDSEDRKVWEQHCGAKEPVIFYKYVGIGNVNPRYFDLIGLRNFLQDVKPFTGNDCYEKAMAYRDKQINRRT